MTMIIGLTGFSGAGKSTVAAVFAEKGFLVLDCDRIVHQEVYRDPAVLAAIAAAFGAECIQNGTIDRTVLREKTMGDPVATQKLNDTVLPFIIAHIRRLIKENVQRPILLDAPLLFESGLDTDCDKTVAVITDPARSLERIVERDHITTEQAERRLASQHSTDYYTERCTYIINNNGGIDDLRHKTEKLIEALYDQTL